jgi:hypothetical protein
MKYTPEMLRDIEAQTILEIERLRSLEPEKRHEEICEMMAVERSFRRKVQKLRRKGKTVMM